MIELRKLTKSFGSKYALRGVNLRVMPGESLVIFGPNGAGKSTLIRILSSLSRPTSGTVHIGGLDLATHADGIRRHLGVVSHAPLLYDSLTAEENLRFFAGLYGMSQPEPRITLLLSAGRADHPPRRPGPHLLARHGATAGDRPGAAARSAGAAAGRAGHRPRPPGRGDAARLAGAGEPGRHGDTGTRGRGDAADTEARRGHGELHPHTPTPPHSPRPSARSSR